jgi:tetratricopeptide (TPR) repeat protein
LPLFRVGDTGPLRSALTRIPRDFDPGGAVTTISLRLSLMDRNFENAERIAGACTREKLNDNGLSGTAAALDDYTMPTSWYAGVIAQRRGDEAAARKAFISARSIVERDLIRSADHAKSVAMLALIYAALGQREDAMREADRAVNLLPIAKDSFDGPFIATARAVVLTQIGEPDRAVAQLQSIVGIPNGPTPGSLRVEPEWDGLREDRRFRRLVDPAYSGHMHG